MNMKTLAIFTTASIIRSIVFSQGLGFTQEVPKLKQKMPYAQAREILIGAGWQAIEIPILHRSDQLFGAMEYIVKKLGYNEAADCSGTSLGLCRFEFVRQMGAG